MSIHSVQILSFLGNMVVRTYENRTQGLLRPLQAYKLWAQTLLPDDLLQGLVIRKQAPLQRHLYFRFCVCVFYSTRTGLRNSGQGKHPPK